MFSAMFQEDARKRVLCLGRGKKEFDVSWIDDWNSISIPEDNVGASILKLQLYMIECLQNLTKLYRDCPESLTIEDCETLNVFLLQVSETHNIIKELIIAEYNKVSSSIDKSDQIALEKDILAINIQYSFYKNQYGSMMEETSGLNMLLKHIRKTDGNYEFNFDEMLDADDIDIVKSQENK